LGVARAEGDGGWRFMGALPLFDPPREDAKTTIATALAMGVKVKMVTGDALAIAKETAKKLDMGANILDASGLGESNKKETTEVAKSIEKADGFAQVFPEHKFHIVDVLQQRGHIVDLHGRNADKNSTRRRHCRRIQAGIRHRGFALIDILQPCVSFNPARAIKTRILGFW